MMAKACKVTDEMFVAATKAVAASVSEEQLKAKKMYPDIADLRTVEARVSQGRPLLACWEGP